MSASLVGSEMCIRDSASFGSPPRANCSSFAGLAMQEDGLSAAHEQPVPCLLYTSDAADDM
eukprot:986190-Alexandrium_andersonii.AAC.1